MKREERKVIFSWAKYTAFLLATIMVVLYQITGISTIVVVSLALYVAAFAIVTISEIEQFIYYTNTKIEEPDEVARLVKEKDLKTKKIVSCASFILSGAFAVFTLVVLIIF